MTETDKTLMPDGGLPYRRSVGICLFNPQGLVFCAERRGTPGAWQMPQGGIQKGEDPEIAVLREMKEEIGTDQADILARVPEPLRYDFPDYLQKRRMFNNKYRGQEQLWFALRFKGTDADIDLSGLHDTEMPEFVRWTWLDLEDVLARIVPFKRPVYEQVARHFQPVAESLRGGRA